MSLSTATTTRSSRPLVPMVPASLGRELVPFSQPAEAEMEGTELVSQMFRVLSLQNEEVRDEAERNFTAFQQNQQRMRETLQTLTEESRRLQAELTASIGRFNELQTMTETEKMAFQASIQRLTEEMRIKNEQIVHLNASVRELKTIKSTYQTSQQTLAVENSQLKAEFATYRAQATQQIALQQAQLTALENQKNAEIARVTNQLRESNTALAYISHTLSEINQPENEAISLVKRRVKGKLHYPGPDGIVVENTTVKQVINDLQNHFGTLGRLIGSVQEYSIASHKGECAIQ